MNEKNALYYLDHISKQLSCAYHDEQLQKNYAWYLLEKICNKTKTELIIAPDVALTPEQIAQLKEWIYLLTVKSMPIQYIMGSVPFNDLDILVQTPILIPRPETEEWTINFVSKLKQLKNKSLSILDL